MELSQPMAHHVTMEPSSSMVNILIILQLFHEFRSTCEVSVLFQEMLMRELLISIVRSIKIGSIIVFHRFLSMYLQQVMR